MLGFPDIFRDVLIALTFSGFLVFIGIYLRLFLRGMTSVVERAEIENELLERLPTENQHGGDVRLRIVDDCFPDRRASGDGSEGNDSDSDDRCALDYRIRIYRHDGN